MVLRWTWKFINDFTLNMELLYKWNSMFDILRKRSTGSDPQNYWGFFYLNDGTENPKRATSPNYPPFSGFFTVWNIYFPLADQISKLWEK